MNDANHPGTWRKALFARSFVTAAISLSNTLERTSGVSEKGYSKVVTADIAGYEQARGLGEKMGGEKNGGKTKAERRGRSL